MYFFLDSQHYCAEMLPNKCLCFCYNDEVTTQTYIDLDPGVELKWNFSTLYFHSTDEDSVIYYHGPYYDEAVKSYRSLVLEFFDGDFQHAHDSNRLQVVKCFPQIDPHTFSLQRNLYDGHISLKETKDHTNRCLAIISKERSTAFTTGTHITTFYGEILHIRTHSHTVLTILDCMILLPEYGFICFHTNRSGETTYDYYFWDGSSMSFHCMNDEEWKTFKSGLEIQQSLVTL